MKIYVRSAEDVKGGAATELVAFMNMGCDCYVAKVTKEQLAIIERRYTFVDSVPASPGLYAISHHYKSVSIDRIASNRADYEKMLKDAYPEFLEYGEGYALIDYWLITGEEEDAPTPEAYVDMCYKALQRTYVDGDSYSNVDLLQLPGMDAVCSGQDPAVILDSADDVLEEDY